jgi:CDGSH-type Zn-finger protein
VTIGENGSALVERDGRSVIRRGGREESTDRVRIALCRCGESSSRPYCDMTHLRVGFVAARTEIVPASVHETGEQEASVKITSMENGPNKVEVEGATGWRVQRGEGEELMERPAIFLCRCGHSENKPFCDGTHNKIGFTAPPAEIEVVKAA